VVVSRGDVWWADLAEPRGSEPGARHPIVVLQSNAFNRSRLRTIVGIVLTSNTRLLAAPGNVLLTAKTTGRPKDSVANVTQYVTLDRDYLDERVGSVPAKVLTRVEDGVRLVLGL